MKTIPELSEKDIKRFWSKIDIKSEDECWNWTAYKNRQGYGQISVNTDKKQTMFTPHRISYFLHYGVDPKELCVCHACDNPSCCNPKHLFLGTHDENNKDRNKKGRCNPPKGSDHFNSKLTEEQIIAIRNDNRTQRVIAKDYNVSFTCICKIKNLKHWKHVV